MRGGFDFGPSRRSKGAESEEEEDWGRWEGGGIVDMIWLDRQVDLEVALILSLPATMAAS